MTLPRESAFLPTIKCSSCGKQVEISMMGDHICGGPTAELSPPPEVSDEFDDAFGPSSIPDYGRAPPKLDTSVANRPFPNRGQLTPVSQTSESRSASPIRAGGRAAPGQTDDAYSRSPSQTRRPGRYGGFDGGGKEEPGGGPGRQISGSSILDQMMNSIAPGPFDAGRRSPAARNAFSARNGSFEKWDGPSPDDLSSRAMDRPGTSHSNVSITVAPPKMPQKNGYGGFGPPPSSSSAAADGLEPPMPGFLGRSGANPPSRLSSASSARSDRLRNSGDERKRPMGPDTSRKPPPRTSLLGQHVSSNVSVDLAAEFGIGNPYHTPSDSASSGYSSTFSHASPSQPTSAQTSPARSYKRRSDDLAPPPLMASDGLRASVESLRPRGFGADGAVQPAQRGPAQLAESPLGPLARAGRHDPAVQAGSLDLPPSSGPYSSGRYSSASSRGRDDRWRTPGLGPRKASREPVALPPSRGDCRACGLAIRGKSISSADGRLTGKYHKACFVCATCSQPFALAEFYVLGDKPYCEQHYHKLNGSLCGGCGRGIEGHYLEDEAHVKHHVGCFRCLDCGRSLSDGYFEVDGRPYCERDAGRRTQPAPSSSPGGYGYGGPEPDALAPPRPAFGMGGLPGRPGRPGLAGPRPAYGAGPGGRMGGGMQPRPRMNKRMTRLGQM